MTVVRTSTRMATRSTISPKVSGPALVQLSSGMLLVLLAVIHVEPLGLSDDARSTLLTLGLGLIGASGLTGVLGYTAPPGQVTISERNTK
jgi:hypothetical protein